jgi:hypothetical protein
MSSCSQCASEAQAGQSFCRHCGAPLDAGATQPQAAGAASGLATAEMTGRSCPYCRFPLKQGASIAECGTCHTVHHAECWEENSGCSITGCAGGPTQATQLHTPASPTAPQAPAPAAQAWPAATPPVPAGLPRQMPVAVAAAVAVVVAILGAAVALALSSGKGGTPTASVPPAAAVVTESTQSQDTATLSSSSEATSDTETAQTNETETESTSSEAAAQSSAPGNQSQTESPLGAVNEHWRDIQTGDYRGAWADESSSLRGEESSWVHGQEAAGIESIDYRFKEGSQSGERANVHIEELRTVSRQNGCQRWSGTYGLIDEGGRWQIADASSLQSHPC